MINAEGEFQASAKMADAARVLATEPCPCNCATSRP